MPKVNSKRGKSHPQNRVSQLSQLPDSETRRIFSLPGQRLRKGELRSAEISLRYQKLNHVTCTNPALLHIFWLVELYLSFQPHIAQVSSHKYLSSPCSWQLPLPTGLSYCFVDSAAQDCPFAFRRCNS